MTGRSTAVAGGRMSRADRHAQLLDAARGFIRDHGVGAFTLGRLAEYAGVTKPVAYDHFGNRDGVLAELYREFEAHQHERLEAALKEVEPELSAVAPVMAGAYIDCALVEGRELADVVAALIGSPLLQRLRQDAEDDYAAKCRRALEPLPGAGPIDTAGLRALLGAADALSRAALSAEVDAVRARATLTRVIMAVASGG